MCQGDHWLIFTIPGEELVLTNLYTLIKQGACRFNFLSRGYRKVITRMQESPASMVPGTGGEMACKERLEPKVEVKEGKKEF